MRLVDEQALVDLREWIIVRTGRLEAAVKEYLSSILQARCVLFFIFCFSSSFMLSTTHDLTLPSPFHRLYMRIIQVSSSTLLRLPTVLRGT